MASNQQTSQDDPFDSLLHLESQFYTEGYNQGAVDGVLAGRTEGRQLGLEKGYQKFLEAGRLYGRALVWANRLPARSSSSLPPAPSPQKLPAVPTTEAETEKKELPPLPKNPRLEKHITTLYALVETESLSMENTDEAVNDFDDRIKRGQGKAKIIERMVGEKSGGEEAGAASKGITV
ncbi:hypothetical protein QBC36DRAFT_217358, partial [Triangularia setosa]